MTGAITSPRQRSQLNANITVRDGREDDFYTLKTIYLASRKSAGCFNDPEHLPDEEFRRLTDGEEILVAEIGSSPVGFISIWPAKNFIHHLYVCPQHKRRGVGRKLLKQADARHPSPLILKSMTTNINACMFYLRLGWKAEKFGRGANGPYILFKLDN